MTSTPVCSHVRGGSSDVGGLKVYLHERLKFANLQIRLKSCICRISSSAYSLVKPPATLLVIQANPSESSRAAPAET